MQVLLYIDDPFEPALRNLDADFQTIPIFLSVIRFKRKDIILGNRLKSLLVNVFSSFNERPQGLINYIQGQYC